MLGEKDVEPSSAIVAVVHVEHEQVGAMHGDVGVGPGRPPFADDDGVGGGAFGPCLD
jgi:hypothetical protein